jgi:hypothetical protein
VAVESTASHDHVDPAPCVVAVDGVQSARRRPRSARIEAKA